MMYINEANEEDRHSPVLVSTEKLYLVYHTVNLYPSPLTVWMYWGSDGSSSIF